MRAKDLKVPISGKTNGLKMIASHHRNIILIILLDDMSAYLIHSDKNTCTFTLVLPPCRRYNPHTKNIETNAELGVKTAVQFNTVLSIIP